MTSAEILLIAASFATSLLTAVVGVSGGVLLISLMPAFLPTPVVIPIHGVVQLASNLSRAGFGRQHLAWSMLAPYSAGVLLGAAVGSPLAVGLPEWVLPATLGSFVLVVTWAPVATWAQRWRGRFFSIGAIQSFVSLFVGAAGPLVTPLLLRENLKRDQVVVTHASMMTVLHTAKVVTFLALGVSLGPYTALLASMIAAVTLGSWVGTRLRSKILPEAKFRIVIKWLLTALGVRLVLSALVA